MRARSNQFEGDQSEVTRPRSCLVRFCWRFTSSRRCFEPNVGRVACRFFGSMLARVDQIFQPLQRFAPVALLGAMVARHDQQRAVGGHAVAGQRPQPRLDRGR